MSVGTVRDIKSVKANIISPAISAFETVPGGPYAEPLRCEQYEFSAAASHQLNNALCDSYIYVLDGTGAVEINRNKSEISEGSAILTYAGEVLVISTSSKISFLVIEVPSPITPWGSALAKPIDMAKRVIITKLGATNKEVASSDREYETLFNENNGSRGATMFVGFIPSSGAPDHYHLYDEICVIVRGAGGLVTSERPLQELKKGSAFHVAPRFLHAIHNPNPEDLWILGVFRPEGSPAAAFYPDGRPAPVDMMDK